MADPTPSQAGLCFVGKSGGHREEGVQEKTHLISLLESFIQWEAIASALNLMPNCRML